MNTVYTLANIKNISGFSECTSFYSIISILLEKYFSIYIEILRPNLIETENNAIPMIQWAIPEKIDEFDPVFFPPGLAYNCYLFLMIGYSTKYLYCRVWDFVLVVETLYTASMKMLFEVSYR